jgi:O-antigen ligase
MTHNSILWIWMKAGVGGFIAMLLLFGKAMRTGARATLRAGRGDFAAMTLTSTAFVLMYAVFAYVDIAWDGQNLVLLAVAMAQICSATRLTKREVVPPDSEGTQPVAGPVLRPIGHEGRRAAPALVASIS